ncbi:MAG: FecR family protein [Betaproteobacteria bacterium]
MKSHSARRLILLPFLSLLFMLGGVPAWAEGTLTHLSGPVSVQKPDGKTLPGSVGAKVAVGDTVVTGTGGYARMEMTDGGEIVLRPDSQLKVESYKFAVAKPTEDSFIFSMLKGGLRTVTGLIGKRGNRDAYELKTQTATIGIRGTQFDLRVCLANCGALADGTYLAVRFGGVQTTNAQGSLAVAAGQVAYVPPQRPPVILPRDPGIGFTPPAVIPKLDEKKKVQPAATGANQPEQAKPSASASGQSAQSNTKPASGSSGSGSTEGSGTGSTSGVKDGSGTDAGGQSGAQSSSGGPVATVQSTDCSVQ